jgi:hypothetical protein
VTEQADHFATYAAKGVQAKLAAGIVGQSTKDPLRDLQGFVTLDEESFPIDRFRHLGTMARQDAERQGTTWPRPSVLGEGKPTPN